MNNTIIRQPLGISLVDDRIIGTAVKVDLTISLRGKEIVLMLYPSDDYTFSKARVGKYSVDIDAVYVEGMSAGDFGDLHSNGLVDLLIAHNVISGKVPNIPDGPMGSVAYYLSSELNEKLKNIISHASD